MTPAKKQLKTFYLHIAFVVAMIFVGSMVALFSSAPDQIFARSQDGHVTLSGVTHDSNSVEIVSFGEKDAFTQNLLGPVYKVDIEDHAFIQNAELNITVDPAWKDITDLTEVEIYFFDEESLVWKSLSTTFDLSDRSVNAPVEFRGDLFVGLGLHVHGG